MHGCGRTRLPLELVDRILFSFEDDRQTLRQVSLTCQSWSQQARRYLFRHLTVHLGGLPDGTLSTRTMEEFNQFVLNSSDTCHIVRVLTLLCAPQDTQYAVNLEQLRQILSMFDQLKAFALFCPWRLDATSLVTHTAHPPIQLDRLNIVTTLPDETEDPDSSPLTHLLSLFSEVNSLSVSRLHAQNLNPAPPSFVDAAILSAALLVRRLEIRSSSDSGEDCLAVALNPHSLRALAVTSTFKVDTSFLNLLSAKCQNLEELTVGTLAAHQFPIHAFKLLPKLIILHLGINISSYLLTYKVHENWQHLIKIVKAALAVVQLREVHISLLQPDVNEPPTSIQVVHWSQLADAIIGHACLSLVNVVITSTPKFGQSYLDDVKELVGRAFPPKLASLVKTGAKDRQEVTWVC